MGIAAVIAVFATENVVDAVVSRYINIEFEVMIWVVIAIVCAAIVHEVGEDRGDW
jgi:hypothetical protein